MADTTSIHPSIPKTLARTLESYDINASELFAKAGIDIESELSLNDRIDGKMIDRLWRMSVDATGNDALGIEFAKHFQLGLLHGLGFSWATSNSLEDAFARLARFFGVISSVGSIKIRHVDDQLHVALLLPVPYGIAEDAGVDSSLALFLQLCRMVRGTEFNPVLVEYQRPEPKSVDDFNSFFNCKVVFNSSENKLVFKKSDVLQALPASNPDLARANDQVVIDYLRKHERSNIVSKVSMLIIDALPSGTPSQQIIADQLHMSAKTLQRRLSAENTAFSALLDDVRIGLAKNYLNQEWRSIGEICYLLGYTEPSNFTRWFRRLTGVTPLVFRER